MGAVGRVEGAGGRAEGGAEGAAAPSARSRAAHEDGVAAGVRGSGGVLAVVPARGGSKGLPRKNLRLLGGHPLIAYSIAAARASARVDRVIVSTDDPEIAAVARDYGAEAPFLRPAELASDETPDAPVFRHALRWFARTEEYRPELIVHLRPTSPIREPGLIDRAIEVLDSRPEADALRTVCPPSQNPYKMWRIEDGWLAPLLEPPGPEAYDRPRQRLPETVWHTGTLDVIRRRTILEHGSMAGQRIVPLAIAPFYAIDIDTLEDLRYAEWRIASGDLPMERPTPAPDLSRYRAVVFDFDGVFTDNRVYVFEDGRESVVCDRSDGLGIAALREAGYRVAVLSTETNGVVAARCRKLGVPYRQGLGAEKAQALRELAAELEVELEEVIYVGNDRNDAECLRLAGLAVTVADAHPEALRHARWMLSRPGGRGAVRELCDHLLTRAGR